MPHWLQNILLAAAAILVFFLVAMTANLIIDGFYGIPGLLAGSYAAVMAWRFLREALAQPRLPLPVAAGAGALLLGGIGFVGGFFGPMLFAPGANQGPMLGIFITGPLGVLLGAIIGAGYALRRSRK